MLDHVLRGLILTYISRESALGWACDLATIVLLVLYLPFPKRQILDSFKPKEFSDDNFKFDENGRKFAKPVESTVGKREIASRSVFKRRILQTREN